MEYIASFPKVYEICSAPQMAKMGGLRTFVICVMTRHNDKEMLKIVATRPDLSNHKFFVSE